jgi:hypothetical protein
MAIKWNDLSRATKSTYLAATTYNDLVTTESTYLVASNLVILLQVGNLC